MHEAPTWAGAQRVLLHSGSVYSPVDPFATAMLVVGPRIAWIGSDGAALAMADGVDEVIDLAGALVLPGFVDVYPSAAVADTGGDGVVCRAGDPRSGAGPLHVPGPPVIVPRDADEAHIALADADAVRGRLLVLAALHAADVALVSRTGAAVCLLPDAQGAVAGLPVASLAAAGVVLSFGSGAAGIPPWRIIAAAVHHPDPDQRISARAAFAAHTRGGWRVLGQPGTGALVEGAPAHYTVSRTGPLLVQAPDDRIQAWSTDPRSGTPGLPDVSPGAVAPECRRTVVWGRIVFGA